MNLDLLEQLSLGQNYPEEFDGTLDGVSYALTGMFNRRGSVLAVGCNDGRIVIWDFLTRGIAKVIPAHTGPITALSWSRNGKLLATSSNDGYACVWDVLTADCVIRWHFDTTVLSVQFSPRNSNILLIRPLKQASLLVKYSVDADGKETKMHSRLPQSDEESEFDVVSTFDRRGEYVYSGNAKGRIQVMQLESGTITPITITSFRVSNTAIKQIEFAPRKKNIFLVNSADRVIRVYNADHILACVSGNTASTGQNNNTRGKRGGMLAANTADAKADPEPIQKLQDLVNRTTWRKCCFSGVPESEFICAGSARQHSLYIWDRNTGALVRILHGTKGETLNDVIWHPVRPVIASIAVGVVSVWSQTQVENWSAFAPDFKELDENIEYEERESEFDEFDEDRTPTRLDVDGKDEDDALVDVDTPNTIYAFLSSDEEQEDPDALVYFPVQVDIDDVEIDQTEESNLFDAEPSNPEKKRKTDELNSPRPLQTQNRNIDPKN